MQLSREVEVAVKSKESERESEKLLVCFDLLQVSAVRF